MIDVQMKGIQKKKIRVLIVDDSALVRQTLTQIFNSDPEIEVMGSVADPYFAASRIKEETPDVISLDIEMPRMDGLTFLKKIMAQHPIPVLIISTLTTNGGETALRALEHGAVDVVCKPKINTQQALHEATITLCDAVKAAYQAEVEKRREPWQKESVIPKKFSADAILSKGREGNTMFETTDKVVAIGASTGGIEALRIFLSAMPIDCPGIVIVQHMPEVFTKSFAQRLNEICQISVKEAEDGDAVVTGQALIAPGNKHMMLKRNGARYIVKLDDGPLVNRHRPSVDVLFRSAARYAGSNAIGVLMTGMGDDGAKGLLEMKMASSQTIAQDEESCTVFGMPRVAIELGAATQVLSLNNMPAKVLMLARNPEPAR
jgi:two-component system chemotaxis response regulator CheB